MFCGSSRSFSLFICLFDRTVVVGCRSVRLASFFFVCLFSFLFGRVARFAVRGAMREGVRARFVLDGFLIGFVKLKKLRIRIF